MIYCNVGAKGGGFRSPHQLWNSWNFEMFDGWFKRSQQPDSDDVQIMFVCCAVDVLFYSILFIEAYYQSNNAELYIE